MAWLNYFLWQLKYWMMETSWWQEEGPTSIGDLITPTRMWVGTKKASSAIGGMDTKAKVGQSRGADCTLKENKLLLKIPGYYWHLKPIVEVFCSPLVQLCQWHAPLDLFCCLTGFRISSLATRDAATSIVVRISQLCDHHHREEVRNSVKHIRHHRVHVRDRERHHRHFRLIPRVKASHPRLAWHG